MFALGNMPSATLRGMHSGWRCGCMLNMLCSAPGAEEWLKFPFSEIARLACKSLGAAVQNFEREVTWKMK